VFTSTFWKRATLGAGLLAALLAGAAPHAMAEGRFRLPYGDGLNSPSSSGSGYLPHSNSPVPVSSGRFGPPGYGDPGNGRPSADLQLANTSAPNPATQGANFDYTLTVTNAGPAPTTDVSLTDQLPNGVRLVQTNASQGVCSVAQQYVRCALDTLEGGRTATVTITVRAVQAGGIYNTASVMGREYDPYEGNNSSTSTTDVQSGQYGADLSVLNTVDKPSAAGGDNLTYTVTVTNHGPALAFGTHLTDQFSQGSQFVSASPSQGTCSPSSADVVCELGDLASGATATVTVVLRAPSSGTAVNTAYITSQMYDPNTGDNQASATTEVGSGSGAGGSAPGPALPVPVSRPTNDGYVF
jgi:uncharacterized repeat protein (TIGR01451 family)